MSDQKPAKAPQTWDSASIRAKAQRYAEEMLACDRTSWQFVFWSSLTLELVARSALAHVSPVLLADGDDWNNLYHALGHTPTASKFAPKSLPTKQVFTRLRQIIPEFGKELEDFCVVHTGRRNAELHSAETPFDTIRNSEWLALFYQSCEVLLDSVGSSLRELFGSNEAEVAEKLIKAAADHAAMAVAGEIAAHHRVWEKKDPTERTNLKEQAAIWATRHDGHVAECPACKSKALLNGTPIAPPAKSINGDLITETQAFLPTKFECVACGLKISGLSQLNASGLGDPFKRTSTYDAASYYARDEGEEDYYEEDNNEPY